MKIKTNKFPRKINLEHNSGIRKQTNKFDIVLDQWIQHALDNGWITVPGSGAGDGVVTNVVLNGTDLEFTGSNGGFNGTIDFSSIGQPDTNFAENDLTLSGSREHTLNGNNLSIVGEGDIKFEYENSNYSILTSSFTDLFSVPDFNGYGDVVTDKNLDYLSLNLVGSINAITGEDFDFGHVIQTGKNPSSPDLQFSQLLVLSDSDTGNVLTRLSSITAFGSDSDANAIIQSGANGNSTTEIKASTLNAEGICTLDAEISKEVVDLTVEVAQSIVSAEVVSPSTGDNLGTVSVSTLRDANSGIIDLSIVSLDNNEEAKITFELFESGGYSLSTLQDSVGNIEWNTTGFTDMEMGIRAGDDIVQDPLLTTLGASIKGTGIIYRRPSNGVIGRLFVGDVSALGGSVDQAGFGVGALDGSTPDVNIATIIDTVSGDGFISYEASSTGGGNAFHDFQINGNTVFGITTNGLFIGSNYTIPYNDGTSNQVLTTDGSGTVTWQDQGGGGNVNTIYTADDQLTGDRIVDAFNFDLTFNAVQTFQVTGSDFTVSVDNDNNISGLNSTLNSTGTTTISGDNFVNIQGGAIPITAGNGDITLDTFSLPSDIRLQSGKDAVIQTVNEMIFIAGNDIEFQLSGANSILEVFDTGGLFFEISRTTDLVTIGDYAANIVPGPHKDISVRLTDSSGYGTNGQVWTSDGNVGFWNTINDTNLANANLVANANRNFDGGGFDLEFGNLNQFRVGLGTTQLVELRAETDMFLLASGNTTIGFNTGTMGDITLQLSNTVSNKLFIKDRSVQDSVASVGDTLQLIDASTGEVEFRGGATGSFTALSGETVTVTNGLITSIV